MTGNGYKALLMDLDGTLARAFLKITPRVVEAVGRVAELVPVGIVSSRDYTVVGRVAREIGLRSLQISEGGARIFDPGTGESRWLQAMAPPDSRSVISFLDESGLSFSAVDGDIVAGSTAEITSWNVTRITATSLTPAQAREIAARFGTLPGIHTAVIVRIDNGDWMVDFTHAQASKAAAVGRYAELHGIAPSQVIAAGDSFNDLPLLQACGLGIAMGNAAPELKVVADYVAPDVDEDGLAVAIDELVLPRLGG